MPSPTPLARGRKHTLAASAFDHYQSGKSERDALEDVLAGKAINAADREDIERELGRMIADAGQDAHPDEPVLAVVPDENPFGDSDDESDRMVPRPEDVARAESIGKAAADAMFGPIVPPPGAAERDAAVERIAAGADRTRPRGARRTLDERRAEAAAAVQQAERAVVQARNALRGVDLFELADLLYSDRRGRDAARMIKASVRSGLIDDAVRFAVAGGLAVGLAIDDEWKGDQVIAGMIEALANRGAP